MHQGGLGASPARSKTSNQKIATSRSSPSAKASPSKEPASTAPPPGWLAEKRELENEITRLKNVVESQTQLIGQQEHQLRLAGKDWEEERAKLLAEIERLKAEALGSSRRQSTGGSDEAEESRRITVASSTRTVDREYDVAEESPKATHHRVNIFGGLNSSDGTDALRPARDSAQDAETIDRLRTEIACLKLDIQGAKAAERQAQAAAQAATRAAAKGFARTATGRIPDRRNSSPIVDSKTPPKPAAPPITASNATENASLNKRLSDAHGELERVRASQARAVNDLKAKLRLLERRDAELQARASRAESQRREAINDRDALVEKYNSIARHAAKYAEDVVIWRQRCHDLNRERQDAWVAGRPADPAFPPGAGLPPSARNSPPRQTPLPPDLAQALLVRPDVHASAARHNTDSMRNSPARYAHIPHTPYFAGPPGLSPRATSPRTTSPQTQHPRTVSPPSQRAARNAWEETRINDREHTPHRAERDMTPSRRDFDARETTARGRSQPRDGNPGMEYRDPYDVGKDAGVMRVRRSMTPDGGRIMSASVTTVSSYTSTREQGR